MQLIGVTKEQSSYLRYYEWLRLEAGWLQVSHGIGRILYGYLIIGAGIAFMAYALLAGSENMIFMASMALCGLEIVGGCWILYGKWQCIYATDRCGSKWLIFCSFLCNFSMMAIFAVSCYGITSSKQVLMLALVIAILSTLSALFWIAFLFSVGRCFPNSALSQVIGGLFLFMILMIGFAVHLGITGEIKVLMDPTQFTYAVSPAAMESYFSGKVTIPPALLLLVGSLIWVLWYLFALVAARGVIRHTYKSTPNPFGHEQY